MSSEFGKKLKIQVFGQSHSEAIGVVIDNLPCGFEIDFDKVSSFMKRRAPGNDIFSTPRKEEDEVEIVSGIYKGVTCGAPLCAMIRNKNVVSKDYDLMADIPRPSHADYAAHKKYKGYNDIRGGGHFSGRLTAPLCFAGAVAMQYLNSFGIYIGAHISSVGSVKDKLYNSVSMTKEELMSASEKDFPVLDDMSASLMRAEILNAKQKGDSIGGSIECAAIGLPVGIGQGMFGGVENNISAAMFAIPALKGIEFGSGFSGCSMRGSEYNDSYFLDNNKVKTNSNNNGGVTGGLTTGMPLIFRVAIKPTPSVFTEQNSISFSKNENVKLQINGRHDPCILKRALPVVEAVCAFTLLDMILYNE